MLNRLLGVALAAPLLLAAAPAVDAQSDVAGMPTLTFQAGQTSVQASSNWSGYVATNAYYTGASALIQAPQPNTFQFLGSIASWVGIGGSQSDDLIQAGVDEINQGPYFSYQAWYEMLPSASRNVVLDVQPGAWVLFDIREVAFNRWQVTIVNGTNVFTTQVNYASSHSSAEWIVEEPTILRRGGTSLLPLAGVTGANFTKMSAIANGHEAIPAQLYPQSVAIVSDAGSLKALPTSLGADGASFSVGTQSSPF